MFIPLYDVNGLKYIKLQTVTIGLIAVNVVVWLLTGFSSEPYATATVYGLGFIPAVAHDVVDLPLSLQLVPESFTYVTYAFLHGDIFHLGGNMLFLWVFGDNVEDALGHLRFLVFYLLCAVAGAFMQGLIAWDSQVPLIGASGAIAGIVAAYLILHPRVRVWVLLFMRIPLPIPAWIVLALWIGTQFLMLAIGGEDQISWSCHVGGIIAGAVLVFLLKRRDQPLLDRELVTPRAVRTLEPAAQAEPGPPPRTPWGRQP